MKLKDNTTTSMLYKLSLTNLPNITCKQLNTIFNKFVKEFGWTDKINSDKFFIFINKQTKKNRKELIEFLTNNNLVMPKIKIIPGNILIIKEKSYFVGLFDSSVVDLYETDTGKNLHSFDYYNKTERDNLTFRIIDFFGIKEKDIKIKKLSDY